MTIFIMSIVGWADKLNAASDQWGPRVDISMTKGRTKVDIFEPMPDTHDPIITTYYIYTEQWKALAEDEANKCIQHLERLCKSNASA